MTDLEAKRKDQPRLEPGTKLKDVATGEIWTIKQRGGMDGTRSVNGVLRLCHFVYSCESEAGEKREIYHDELDHKEVKRV